MVGRSVTLLVILSLTAVPLTGCLDMGKPQGTPALAPLEVDLKIEDPSGLYRDQGALFTITLRVNSDANRVAAGLVLPTGTHTVDGSFVHDGPIRTDAPVVLRGRVAADGPGRYVFRAWSEHWDLKDAGSRATPGVSLGVRGDADHGEVFEADFPRLRYTVRLAADEDNPAHLVGTVESPITMEAYVYLWTPGPPNGLELIEGSPEWNGTLDAGEPRVFNYRVRPYEQADDGRYRPMLVLHPDASLGGGVSEDTQCYVLEEGQLKTASGC